ncbi:MAG: 6-phosphogluconolactonase [Acidimicrobiia bacterium]
MIRILRAGPDLADVAANVIVEELEVRMALRGRASVAVSGGRTPWPVFERLSEAPIRWTAIDVFQVDERVAPPGSADRNLTGLAETLLDRVQAIAHPMPVDEPDLEAAAHRYAAELPSSLDVVHLGLGDDGHTASLVPSDPVVLIEDQLVAITDPYRGHRRMTLTRPVLDRAGLIVWIVAGADKAEMVERLVAGDTSFPAGLISQERAVLVTDAI